MPLAFAFCRADVRVFGLNKSKQDYNSVYTFCWKVVICFFSRKKETAIHKPALVYAIYIFLVYWGIEIINDFPDINYSHAFTDKIP